VSFTNLLVVAVVAFVAPLAVRAIPWVRVPSPVLEIVCGIVFGPSLLGWVGVDAPVEVLALMGLAFLLFLAGLEIDVHRLRGRPLQLAVPGSSCRSRSPSAPGSRWPLPSSPAPPDGAGESRRRRRATRCADPSVLQQGRAPRCGAGGCAGRQWPSGGDGAD
jgi:hypothetical protein